MKVTKEQAKKIGDKLHVNFNVVSLDDWHFGMNAEMEHKNVTHGNLTITGKIALAHFMEFPDYYKRLKKLESSAEKFWAKKDKPNVIIPFKKGIPK